MARNPWTYLLGATALLGLALSIARDADSEPQRGPAVVTKPVPARADPQSKPRPPANPGGVNAPAGKRLMYTTYFYTANEAVVHGYEAKTRVRIISLERKGTVWSGVVGPGETKLVQTGAGVFAFLADKKASILVGTPSRCAVVGYWARDRNGSFRSDHFYSRLPSSGGAKEKVLVWAWEDTEVQIIDRTNKRRLFAGKLKAGGYHEIGSGQVTALNSSVLEVKADKRAVSLQVYYDEGFFVPSSDGRAAGKVFQTYLGGITNGVNDLSLFAYDAAAKIRVLDLKSDKTIWSGKLAPGKLHTITLKDRYVRVVSDVEISVAVAPYKHYQGSYAEHHYAAGQEGTGIENHFLLTTPSELWIFSYYDKNPIVVTNAKTGKVVWKGTLGAGQATGVHPGHGYYRVRSVKGISVMGGAMACGAEFSPAGSLFSVDEALLKVVQQIRVQRQVQAAAQGRVATQGELDAPLSDDEVQQATSAVRKATKKQRISPAETRERLKKMKTY